MRNFNASRALTSGMGKNNIIQPLRETTQKGMAPNIFRAVVVEVISDPTSFTDNELEELENKVVNPELVEGMPYNSIIGRIITNEEDLGNSALHVFYPMFPTHVQMPVKPGEHVLIMYEDYSVGGSSFGYWLVRPMAARQIEDPNFTHHDRFYDPYNHPREIRREQMASLTSSAPNFPNGAGTPESFSLKPRGNENPYEEIKNSAKASKISFMEAVGRYKKRPGDLAFQGSNNTLISLGTDRTGPVFPITGSSGTDILEGSGTIDMVAGLGSVRTAPEDETVDPSENNKNKTAPRIIKNTRNTKEVYKTPYRSQKRDNPNEADPDFASDLSRIYVSMKTKGDKNFGITLDTDNGIFPHLNLKLLNAITELPSENQEGQPFVILKSDHIRIIARGKNEEYNIPESGDIRIIKEGKVEDKDLSLFVMDKEGNIVFVGKNIQFQTHEEGKVLLKCKNSEPDEADPIILYSKFKECIEEINSKVDTLKRNIAQEIGKMGSIGLSVPNAAGPFSPIPGLLSLKATLVSAQSNILSTDTNFTSKIEPCKSKWIFVNKEN